MFFIVLRQAHPPHMAKEAFCSALSKKGVPLCYEQSIRMHENIYIYITQENQQILITITFS